MSMEQPPKNKMIGQAPAMKEFHFAATVEHRAQVVLAATIQEAEEIYHRTKQLINQPEAASSAPTTVVEDDITS